MSDVQELEISLAAAKELAKDHEALEALYKNKHFIRLIENKYFKEEPARLVSLMADPQFQSAERQESLQRDLRAVSCLLAFFRTVNQAGEQIKRDIEAYESALDEARSE